MLWLILGDYGGGKTTYLVLLPFSEEYKDYNVVGNFTLKHPRYKKIKVLDLMKIKGNTLVLLDEMQNWFNSHETFSLTNDYLTDFIHLCDKRNIDVFGTAHRFMSLDNDFRIGCHRIVKCERIGVKVNRRLDDKRDFRFSVISTYSGKLIERRILKYEKAKLYFELFDTKERILRHNQPDRDLRLIMQHDPEEGTRMLEIIAKRIRERVKNGSEITHAKLRIELGRLGYGRTFEEDIYVLVRESPINKNMT